MRRSELVALGGYRERGWPEDYDLWLRYHRAGKLFAKVPEVLFIGANTPSAQRTLSPAIPLRASCELRRTISLMDHCMGVTVCSFGGRVRRGVG